MHILLMIYSDLPNNPYVVSYYTMGTIGVHLYKQNPKPSLPAAAFDQQTVVNEPMQRLGRRGALRRRFFGLGRHGYRESATSMTSTLESGGQNNPSVTFYYEPDTNEENAPVLAGRNFFNDGRFGVDINGDTNIDSDANEFIDVTGGSITMTRTGDAQALMAFNITLANGVQLIGSFEGVFPIFDIQ